MAELTRRRESRERSAVSRGPVFYIGGGALLAAMGIEALSVLGRHIGVPLLGALEIIQAVILLAATSAMLCATLAGAHATVTFLTDRLSERPKRALKLFSHVLSALFFAGLTVGALWLAIEYWDAHEVSELLHIPFKPLRVVTFLVTAAIAVVFLRDLVREARR
ncbi:MAG: TRAP transporter small permease subunit [Pseudomonadota bacterium]|nr:MAG: hypothetical protein DIU56_01170 [Pseudomonadota bacterium]